jgi:hypothetical protein
MRKCVACLALWSAGAAAQAPPYEPEGLPDSVVARIQVRDRFLTELPRSTSGFSPQFVIQTLKRWTPGSTVLAAFNGGDNTLRKQIADAASVWVSYGNIKLDFGYNPTNGAYRSWSPGDQNRVADIRISFNQSGYWSVVGHDSDDPSIVGSGEASMNLGGFTISLPGDWQAVVEHEFGHAFGFEHEHQSPISGCDAQFHWYDDTNYQPTKDQYGQYIQDSQQRRPGVYTVLGGPPNNWVASKVDYNLKQLPNSSAFNVGPFDVKSIMMYSFPAWMFVSPTSPCHTDENLVPSAQDQIGFATNYPFAAADVTLELNRRKEFLGAILNASQLTIESKAPFDALFKAMQ